jgi:SAM-dependent methyltransferase
MNVYEMIGASIVNRSHERPLEYLFVWLNLMVLTHVCGSGGRTVGILDVGGADSRLAMTLADLGFDVTVVDIADVEHGKAKYVKANILLHEFPVQSFDICVSISTIEHVGLPAYGQTILDDEGDVKAMKKIYRWLRRGGYAIITVPYGRLHHPPTFERVYNRETLRSRILSADWHVVSELYICNDGGWRPCSEVEAERRDACVLLVLQKP